MIYDGNAGYSCLNCGAEQSTNDPKTAKELEQKLTWSKAGNPFCPECGHATTFEDYIDKAIHEHK